MRVRFFWGETSQASGYDLGKVRVGFLVIWM